MLAHTKYYLPENNPYNKSQKIIGLFFLALLGGTALIINYRNNILAPNVTSADNDLTDNNTKTRMLRAQIPDTAGNALTPKANILIVTTDDMTATAIPPFVDSSHTMFPPGINPSWNEFLKTAIAFKGVTPITVCAPSRISFLTGRLADRLKIHTFERLPQQAAPQISTVFKYFKDNLGYEAFVAGKVFHNNAADQNRNIEYYSGQLSRPRAATEGGNSECIGYMYCNKALNKAADNAVVAKVDQFFKEMASKNKPFIAGAGLHRPHLTNAVPKKFYSQLNCKLPNYATPQIPGTDFWQSLAYKEDDGSSKYKINFGTNQKPNWQKIVDGTRRKSPRDLFTKENAKAVQNMCEAYLAGVRFTLYNFGRIVDSLKKYNLYNNTHIVFLGDHGWHNGEYKILGKNTLFPETTNVPYFIHPAGQTTGFTYSEPVSTRTMYATLVELVHGADRLKNFNDNSGMPLDSVSLVPTFTNPNFKINDLAFSQYPRCQKRGTTQVSDCMTSDGPNTCNRPLITYMGYAVEDSNYSYIEWRKYNDVRTGCAHPSWPGMPTVLNGIGENWSQIDPKLTGTDWNSEPVEQEFYQMQNRKPITENLAVNPTSANQALMNQYSNKLKNKLAGF